MKSTKTFEERVMAFLKLDESSKVAKFKKQAVKVWEEQIAIRRKEVEDLEAKKEELLQEKSQEVVLNVEVERLSTIDSREAYLGVYQSKLLKLKASVDEFDNQIETKLAEVENFEWLIDQLAPKEVE